jgi:hypothetical protein
VAQIPCTDGAGQLISGLSSALIVGGLLASVSTAIASVFLLTAAFVWLAERYDPVIAGLGLGALFLLIAIVVLAYCIWLRRRTIYRAELALASSRNTPWLDPKLLGAAVQSSHAIGLRKIVPLLALGFLATGIAMQFGRGRTDF